MLINNHMTLKDVLLQDHKVKSFFFFNKRKIVKFHLKIYKYLFYGWISRTKNRYSLVVFVYYVFSS